MQITYVLELLKPTKIKQDIIEQNILECFNNRTQIASNLQSGKNRLSSKDFKEKLPSAVVNQNIREVKALLKLFKKSRSSKDNIDFKKNQPLCFNNQNYKINNHFVSFPLYTDKSRRYWFPIVENKRFNELNNHIKDGAKLGKSSLFKKNGKYFLAVTIKLIEKVKVLPNLNITNEGQYIEAKKPKNNIMGIDVGLNQLAVASIQNANGLEIARQFHNGKEVGFIRRRYRALRRSLGRAKHPKNIKAIKDKESLYITNLNHKISRKLVNFAVQGKVSIIVMEDLANIRKTAYSSKKADTNLNSWSFYELQQFIEYKAKLSAIEVVYIDPSYTSQTCSFCGVVKKSNRRRNMYSCSCGNQVHSDLNASRNICSKISA